jgi:hypothetical protein
LTVHLVAVNVIRQAIKLSAVLVLLIPAAARAECAAETVPRLLNGPFAAPLVFRGTVRDVEKPTNQPLFEIVTFRVAEIWKGNIGREIALGQMMTAESISFAPEQEYLVVAYDPATATIRLPLLHRTCSRFRTAPAVRLMSQNAVVFFGTLAGAERLLVSERERSDGGLSEQTFEPMPGTGLCGRS